MTKQPYDPRHAGGLAYSVKDMLLMALLALSVVCWAFIGWALWDTLSRPAPCASIWADKVLCASGSDHPLPP